jgi:serine/threonine protein kinase
MQFTSTYSSPERSNACDQRKVDVWAAGCILYELCAGKPFIQAKTQRECFVAMAQFFDASWHPPKLSRQMMCWQPLLNAMMAKDPEDRPLPADLLAFDIFSCVST